MDYVESLEHLLVPDSGDGEIGYKFRTGETLILGREKDSKDRNRVYNNLKTAYEFRSAIVHGEDISELSGGIW